MLINRGQQGGGKSSCPGSSAAYGAKPSLVKPTGLALVATVSSETNRAGSETSSSALALVATTRRVGRQSFSG